MTDIAPLKLNTIACLNESQFIIEDMALIVRQSDMHTCPLSTGWVPHIGGPVLQGSPNVMSAKQPVARVGDQCQCQGPPDSIVTGSLTVRINGLPAARVGDKTAHGGTLAFGSLNVNVG